MDTKIVYNYAPETGEYLGTETAYKSPQEPGIFLMPAHSTEADPPAASAGQVAVYRNGTWKLIDDHREEEWYDTATHERHEIKTLDEVIPETWTLLVPTDAEAVWNGRAWEVPFIVLKERKCHEIVTARHFAIAVGTTWRDHVIDTDEDAQRAISAQIVKSMAYQQLGRPVPDSPWRLKDGSYIMLTDADFWDLSQTIEAHVSACYAREAALIAQVEAAQTAEELAAIVWAENLEA